MYLKKYYLKRKRTAITAIRAITAIAAITAITAIAAITHKKPGAMWKGSLLLNAQLNKLNYTVGTKLNFWVKIML
jgi:hypothetical protein